MADHGTVELGTATGVDFSAHEKTYLGFLSLLKWSLGGIIALLIFMAIFLL